MNLKELHLFIANKLTTDLGLKVLIWNNQLSTLDEQKAVKYPLLYIEYTNVDYTTQTQQNQLAEVSFNVHIIDTKLDAETNLGIFETSNKLYQSLQGQKHIKRVAEFPDHSHNNIIHWIVEFEINYLFTLKDTVLIDKNLTDLEINS